MKTELKDVLHLYLGCQCKMDDERIGRLAGIDLCQNDNSITMLTIRFSDDINDDWSVYNDDEDFGRIKPILRRLEDMTEEHENEVCNILGITGIDAFKRAFIKEGTYMIKLKDSVELYTSLLKRRYDLYSLIDSGQAIDAKTIK